ncbi:MAG: hypothetical protein H6828_07590 [Planctomycetes bacterium]|nr:hypothetical protein [Planctomycetota bacterium]
MKRSRDERTPELPGLEPGDGALVASRPRTEPQGRGIARRYAARSAEVFLYWMPVWVPLVLLAQLTQGGLSPALREQEDLERKELELSQRLASDESRAHELDLKVEALGDEIYHERLLRLYSDEVREEVERRDLAPRPSSEAPTGDR